MKRKIIFINEPTMISCAGVAYYNDINIYYRDILVSKGYDVEIRSLLYAFGEKHIYDPSLSGGVGDKGTGWIMKLKVYEKLIEEDHSNHLFIFNPVSYATLLTNVVDNLILHDTKKGICDFLLSVKYVVLSHELFKDDFSITGYRDKYNYTDFNTFFFSNSEMNCVNNGISILEKYGIYNNKYFVLGHCNLLKENYPTNSVKKIDILFYGNISESLTPYRFKMLEQFKKINLKYNVVAKTNIYGDELDRYLKDSKIVIHIPSHIESNLVPFAKITNLQKKGIFFIIEEPNDENVPDIANYVCTYKKGNVQDLYDKITYYLGSGGKSEIDAFIGKGYRFIEKYNFDLCEVISGINFAREKIFFMNNNHEFFTKWTSVKFYVTMMNMIKRVLWKGNKKPVLINEFGLPGDLVLIDISLVLFMHLHPNKFSLEDIVKRKYILIIGENVDDDHNTFMGWDSEDLKKLSFSWDSILYTLIKNSYKVTFQNDKLFDLLKKIKNNIQLLPKIRSNIPLSLPRIAGGLTPSKLLDRTIVDKFKFGYQNPFVSSIQSASSKMDYRNDNGILFFPIDCYSPEYVINNPVNCDIDVLYYGSTAYKRRQNIIIDLMNNFSFNLVVVNNVFDLNDLINRSKIILHINSIDNCIHIPYAKIGKLLSNNKIVMIEETEELIKSDLFQFVQTFKLSNGNLLDKMIYILKNYNVYMDQLNKLNPAKYLEENYNFEKNTIALTN